MEAGIRSWSAALILPAAHQYIATILLSIDAPKRLNSVSHKAQIDEKARTLDDREVQVNTHLHDIGISFGYRALARVYRNCFPRCLHFALRHHTTSRLFAESSSVALSPESAGTTMPICRRGLSNHSHPVSLIPAFSLRHGPWSSRS